MHFHHGKHQHEPHLVSVVMTNVVVMDGLALKRSTNTTYKRKGEKVKIQSFLTFKLLSQLKVFLNLLSHLISTILRSRQKGDY